MKHIKPLYMSIFWVVLGIILCALHWAGLIEEFWNSMGFAFIFVGIAQLIRYIRYATNPAYREKTDIETNDERNKFIANKAWAWAGYFYVMIAAVGTIVCKLLGREDLMMFCSGSVCLIMVLYWLSWLRLKKKY